MRRLGRILMALAATTVVVFPAIAIVGLSQTAARAAGAPSTMQSRPVLPTGKWEESAGSYAVDGIGRRLRASKEHKQRAVAAGRGFTVDTLDFSLPVLMGNFADNAHIFAPDDYDSLIFGPYATGSMADYYDEVSYGQFQLSGSVYGPYTATETQAWYMNGDNGTGADFPTNYAGFLYSILDAADPGLDFGQYDNDGPDGLPNSGDDDGFVDALMVIHPDGSEATGDADNFRAAYVSMGRHGAPIYVTDDPQSGGGFIQIDRNGRVGGEMGDGTLDQIQLIGIVCHEFAHALGLPDLYDDDGSSNGLGTWCLMSRSSGACGCAGGGVRPTHLSAWCKVELGWVIPTLVTGTQTVQIPPVETTPTIYKLWEDGYQGGRYFLLENRTRTGFDSLITGEGVLIWHCNEEVVHGGYMNLIDDFRFLDLEEADGLDQIDDKTSVMDDGDPYPGATNNTAFNDTSYPAAHDVHGVPTGASAEGFAYVAGPGSDVSVTLTQREVLGYTIAYHQRRHQIKAGIGTSTPSVSYGAARFNAPSPGELVGIRATAFSNTPVNHVVRIFDDMIAGSPLGLHSTTSGAFPSVPNGRYHEIVLSSALALSASQTFVIDVAWGPDDFAVPYTRTNPISGESFWSLDGSSYNSMPAADVLIKALVRTCNCPSQGDVAPIASDGDGAVDVLDVVALIDEVFRSGPATTQNASCPHPRGDLAPATAGVNCGDGAKDVLDVVATIDHVFRSGPAPCDPCGP